MIESENPIQKEPKIGRPESPTRNAWRQYFLKSKQEEILRVEETAKFLTGLSSVVFTILQIFNLNNASFLPSGTWAKIGFIVWMISLATSLFVLFPGKYKFSINEAAKFESIHDSIVHRKRLILLISTFSFFLAMLLMIIQVFMVPESKHLPEKTINQHGRDTFILLYPKNAIELLKTDSTQIISNQSLK